jgi:hypothetical protein
MQTYVAEIDGRGYSRFARSMTQARKLGSTSMPSCGTRSKRFTVAAGAYGMAERTSLRAKRARAIDDMEPIERRVAGADPFEEADTITVWLIPTSAERRTVQAT